MSSASKRIFLSARLPGFTGRGDKYLGEIAQQLRRVLLKTQNSFVYPACQLPDAAWSDVAVLLVEWAEDVHNDIGLWRTVETHQRQCFGTPLPLIVNESPEVEPHGFDPLRIRFFLWSLWPCFKPEQVLSPAHEDLKRLAEAASRLLAERFACVPRDSGVARFLAGPNEYGWEIKRKLLWMGINSYLFRFQFFEYLDEHQGEPDIQTKDDFVCQHCTEWSGLGVIDVLAGTLNVPADDKATRAQPMHKLKPMGQPMHYDPPQYNFDGLSSVGGNGVSTFSYIQLFRNGAIESVTARIAAGKLVLGNRFEGDLMQTRGYINFQKEIGAEPPLFLAISILTAKGFTFYPREPTGMDLWTHITPIQQEVMAVPEVMMEDDNADIGTLIRPALDALWQSSGWPGSPGYDENGKWVGYLRWLR